jgi:hypothetical protein
MSISIDVHLYDATKLLQALNKWGATDADMTMNILGECGSFLGGTYVLLNNEFYSDSPYYAVAELFDAAFGKEDSFDVFLDVGDKIGRDGISCVDKDEIAEKLGINWHSEDDDDEDE